MSDYPRKGKRRYLRPAAGPEAKRAYVSEKVRHTILARQAKKCANKPGRKSYGLSGFACPLWTAGTGAFDESGLHIDHITEWTLTHDNSPENLQALCPCCHAVKTKRFAADHAANQRLKRRVSLQIEVESALKLIVEY
jgi:hypothetical protein